MVYRSARFHRKHKATGGVRQFTVPCLVKFFDFDLVCHGSNKHTQVCVCSKLSPLNWRKDPGLGESFLIGCSVEAQT